MTKERVLPHVTDETERLAVERRDRLAAELRANLARRKAQRRERAADDTASDKDGGAP